MSLALEAAQQVGVSVAAAGALLAALYGRKVLAWAGRLSSWASIAIIVLSVIGGGSLLGWWEIHLGTVQEHLGVMGRVLSDIVQWTADRIGRTVG